MEGNNEKTYTVLSRAIDGDYYAGLTSPRCNSPLFRFNLDIFLDQVASEARESREAGPCETDSVQARGYIVASCFGSTSWVAEIYMAETWSDNFERIRWLPQPCWG
jgi:hypothetical protein